MGTFKVILKILGIILMAGLVFLGLIGTLAGDYAIGLSLVAAGGIAIYFLARKPKEERQRIAAERAYQKTLAAAAKKERDSHPPSSASVPGTVPQPVRRRPRTLSVVLLVFGVLIALFWIASQRTSGGNVDPQVAPVNHFSGRSEVVNSGEMAAGSSGVKVDGNYGPGDTVSMNGVLITFHGITETLGDGLFKPDDNKIFVIAEFTVENNTGDQINISSVFGSAAYCDNYLVSESMSAELGDPQHRNNLTGSLDTGRKLRGIIGYELPSQWQRLEIRLRTDWWKGSKADEITFLVEAA